MKTQQECWEAVIDGETLENISDPNDCWCMSSDGHLVHAITGRHQPPFGLREESPRTIH